MYIVYYTSDDHGHEALAPVFKALKGEEQTFISPRGRFGLKAQKFSLGPLRVAKHPDVLVGFRLWWGTDRKVGTAARGLNIPVIMVNHGAMFVYNEAQKYKRSLFPANVNCVWGQHDADLWKRWTQERVVITGNPAHDVLRKGFRPIIEEPYALLLSMRTQKELLWKAAKNLSKKMKIVVKCHPLDRDCEVRAGGWEVHRKAKDLFPLIQHSKCILSNVSSAIIPALFWKKPIYIFSQERPGYHMDEFKNNRFAGSFNFKATPLWGDGLVQPKLPQEGAYEHFGGPRDGGNALRVAKIVQEYGGGNV